MDTVEIVVYLLVAAIIGGLLLFVTYDLANQDTVDAVQKNFEDKELGFATVNETITEYLFSVWEECNFGMSPLNVTFQYTGEELPKEVFFEEVKRLRLCNSLSSAQHDCGSREDLSINYSSGSLEKGIIVAECFRSQEGGKLQLCSANGCEIPPLPPVNGLCGSHNDTFAFDVVDWPLGTFCEAGTPQPTPQFPDVNSSVSWDCLGEHGGNSITCSAFREEEPDDTGGGPDDEENKPPIDPIGIG